MSFHRSKRLFPFVIAIFLALAACSEDEVTGNGNDRPSDCPAGEKWNPVNEECEPDGNGGDEDAGHDDDGGDDTDGGDNGGDDVDPCDGLSCEFVDCPDGQETTISGVVTIPSGELPLPDVDVYIPGDQLVPITEGASCEPCDEELSAPIARGAKTEIDGSFVIEDAPAGAEVPLVIEVGKWRRQHVIEIQECQDNPLDSDLTRLPRNQDEGNIPRMAITTGEWDALECLPKRIGLDRSEFTPESEDGSVHLFAARGGTNRYDSSMNNGASFSSALQWWDSLDNLLNYDIVLHSCEGSANLNDKSQQARDALYDFTLAGGRVFLSHWHQVWLEHGPTPFTEVADWNDDLEMIALGEPEIGTIDTSFDKGAMLAEWMFETGTTPAGEFPIYEARATIDSINPAHAQRWVWLDEPEGFEWPPFMPVPPEMEDLLADPPEYLDQYFSFNTPLDALETEQCGRVVFSDIHVAAGNTSSPDHPFPQGCTGGALTDQEKALVFMLFDLSRCIVPDGKKSDF